MKIDFSEKLRESLQDPEFLKAYLNEALQQGGLKIFLLAIFQAIKSKPGGMSACAESTGISRQTLYNALSYKGNPRFDNLIIILNYIGFHLTIEPLQTRK